MKRLICIVFLLMCATSVVASERGYFRWINNNDNNTLICVFGSANNESIYGCTVVINAATTSDVLRAGKNASHLSFTIRSGTAGVNIRGASTVAGHINEASIEIGLFTELDVAEMFRNNIATSGMGTPPPMYKAIVNSNSKITFAQMNRSAPDSVFLSQYGNYTIPLGQSRYIVVKFTPFNDADPVSYINTYGISIVARFGYR